MLRKVELIIFLLIVVGFVVLNNNLGKMVDSKQIEDKKETIVLDAGHGGKDPGKVGVNNALEKDINLQIAEILKVCLAEKGYTVIMTRADDEMAGGNSKREDMEKRVQLINEENPAIAISIHQNSYTDPEVSGAQVFYYSESETGKKYAEIVQNELLAFDPQNHRQAKANDNYYLLTRTKVPAIIVECGFLSNYEEAEKLTEGEYQKEISKAIVRGIESCFGN